VLSFQLRCLVIYKARRMGVPEFLIDPRNTSRTCPAYGHVDVAICPSQSGFSCVVCGFAGLANQIATINISRRMVVNLTIVARDPHSPGPWGKCEAKAAFAELR